MFTFTKKKADVEAILGASLTKAVYAARKKGTSRNPNCVQLCETSPSFCIDDGGGLFAAPFDFETGKILRDWTYHGSGSSTINYLEQVTSGAVAPDNKAIVFIEYSHGYRSWSVTVVSPNITKQVGGDQ